MDTPKTVATATLDNRAPDASVVATVAIARAAAVCATHLASRRLIARCDPKLTITTQPNRLHDLLVALIEQASGRFGTPCDVRLSAARVGKRVVLEIDGGPLTSPGVTRLYGLALAVRGRVELASEDQTGTSLRVHIPQGRTGDLPDNVA